MKLFTKNKKGSLSLSMEAIVILILAVVMLGLGLTFVRGMFGNIQNKANEVVTRADIQLQPSESEPIVFSLSRFEIRERRTTDMQVGFYNAHPFETEWIMRVSDGLGVDCPSGNTFICYDGAIVPTYRNIPFTLEKDQSVTWNLILEATEGSVHMISPGAATAPSLLTVIFCKPDGSGDECDDSDDAVYYQREFMVTIRR
ncbi:MAG: hypothetical protein ACMXYG_06490 [Candidatus Woesearchaeota archaeon]